MNLYHGITGKLIFLLECNGRRRENGHSRSKSISQVRAFFQIKYYCNQRAVYFSLQAVMIQITRREESGAARQSSYFLVLDIVLALEMFGGSRISPIKMAEEPSLFPTSSC